MEAAPSATAKHRRALLLTLGVTFGYALVQATAGYFTNSLALIADAGHMLTDSFGVAIALFASWIGQRPANPNKTYGYYRVEILAALLNGVVLFSMAIFIFIEAAKRLSQPEAVNSVPMLVVAVLGLGVNLFGIWNLHEGAGESLNMKGAFLEVLSDTLGSIGAITAAIIILTTGWVYADPLFSMVIGLFILPRTYGVMSEAVGILLEGTPAHISIAAVEEALRKVDGVAAVHDLHVWTITSGMVALSAHVVLAEGQPPERGYALVDDLCELLQKEFAIGHSTIQVERSDRSEREMRH